MNYRIVASEKDVIMYNQTKDSEFFYHQWHIRNCVHGESEVTYLHFGAMVKEER